MIGQTISHHPPSRSSAAGNAAQIVSDLESRTTSKLRRRLNSSAFSPLRCRLPRPHQHGRDRWSQPNFRGIDHPEPPCVCWLGYIQCVRQIRSHKRNVSEIILTPGSEQGGTTIRGVGDSETIQKRRSRKPPCKLPRSGLLARDNFRVARHSGKAIAGVSQLT
jgi:hypothetical protein